MIVIEQDCNTFALFIKRPLDFWKMFLVQSFLLSKMEAVQIEFVKLPDDRVVEALSEVHSIGVVVENTWHVARWT